MIHKINHMTADVHFDQPEHALAHQDNLPGFVKNRLADLIQQVLDEVCPKQETVKIRKLVVDLGRVNPENFEQEMVSKLRTSLLEALGNEIIPGSPPSHPSFYSMAQKFIEIILAGSRQNIDPYWIPLMAAYGRETKAMLLEKGRQPIVRKNIAWLFPTERLKELVRLFEPYHHGFIDYFLERPDTLLAQEIVQTESSGVFKKQVAEFILAYLFVEKGSRFNKKIFLSSVISQISGHYNIRYHGLLASLIRLFETIRDDSPLKKEILALLLDLEHGTRSREQWRQQGQGNRPVDLQDKQIVFSYLLQGGTRPEKDPGDILDRLAKTDPESIVRFLGRNRHRTGVTKKMVRLLEIPVLRRILYIQHPAKYLVIQTYIAALSQAYYSQLFSGSEKMASLMVWEAVLGFDPPFEEQRFCQHLLTRVAENATMSGTRYRFFNRFIIRLVLDLRKNREHYDLLKAVLELKGMRSGLELLREKGFESLDNALAFFRHYLKKPNNRIHMARAFPQSRIQKLVRLIQPVQCDFIDGVIHEAGLFFKQTPGQDQGGFGVLMNEFVLEFLARDRSGGFNKKNFMAGIVWQMTRKSSLGYGGQIRLFRRFMAGKKGQNPLKHQMADLILELEKELSSDGKARESSKSPKALVMVLLTQVLPGKGNETSYLLNAVKKFETKARDKTAYYYAILEKLLRNSTIDFEQILAPASVETNLEKTDPNQTVFTDKIFSLLRRDPVHLHQFLTVHIHRPGFIRLLIRSVDSVDLNRILYLLRPRDFVRIKQYTRILEKSLFRIFDFAPGLEMEKIIWRAVFMGIKDAGQCHTIDGHLFIPSFLKTMAQAIPKIGSPDLYARLEEQVVRHDADPELESSHLSLTQVISSHVPPVCVQDAEPPPKTWVEKISTPPKKEPDGETPMETIYPNNCGLVLVAPYLPSLFKSLGMIENSRFKDLESARHGVRLLQYLANKTTDLPWHVLALNRILCGVKPQIQEENPFQVDSKEEEVIESLISGIIQNWPALGATSIQGFRESFLMRNGTLTLEQDDCWHLKVEPRAFDMLLDSIPWSYSPLKLPWMDRLLYVDWR